MRNTRIRAADSLVTGQPPGLTLRAISQNGQNWKVFGLCGYRPGIEWLRGDFQNVARWEPGHRLEAYATLACRRGCRWSQTTLIFAPFNRGLSHLGRYRRASEVGEMAGGSLIVACIS